MPRPVPALILPALLAAALVSAGVREAPARPAGKVRQETKAATAPAPAPAANPYAPDRAEPGSVEAIGALTSSLRFLPPAVAYLPAAPAPVPPAGSAAAEEPGGAGEGPGAPAGAAAAAIPSPEVVLGHVAGAVDVAGAEAVGGYFHRLAAASDRVRVQTVGKSEEGREILLAAVSAAHNLTELPFFREAAARLADPRRTDAAAAERLAGSGKLLYYLVGGSQPGEMASPEMLAELAYRLAVSERPDIAAVREEAVVLITPVAEPDAYERAVEWDRSQARQHPGTPWADLAEILRPPYTAHYAGAGWTALGGEAGALASTRAIAAAFFGFHPQVVQGFALRTAAPPLVGFDGGGGAPSPPEAKGAPEEAGLADGGDPWPALARAVATSLRAYGMPGVEEALPVAAAQAPELAIEHNAVGGVIAVFGNGSSGAYERLVGDLEPAPAPGAASAASAASATAEAAAGARAGVPAAGARPGAPAAGATAAAPAAAARAGSPVAPRATATGRGAVEVLTPAGGWPPQGRTRWSLRDSVNYAESATLEALAWAAAHRRELLVGTWRRADRALRQPAEGVGPAAWAIAARQPDPARLAALVRRLLDQRIEVHRLSGDVTVEGRVLPVGTYLVRLDQPYRIAVLRHLGGGPGGAVGWPWIYGVEATAIGDRAILDAPMEAVTAPAPASGRVVGGSAGGEAPTAGTPGAAAPPGAAGGPPGPAGAVAGAAPSPPGSEAAAGVAARDEVFLLRDTGETSLVAARLAFGTYQVDAAEEAFKVGGVSYPVGSWIVQAPRPRVERVAERLGLTLAAAALPDVPRHVVHLPRLAVLHGWTDTEPSAWLRAVLDADHLPYTLIAADDLRRGSLGERFDVILVAGADPDWQRTLRGIDSRWSSLAYSRAAELPSLGVPDAAADVAGGWGDAGVQELRHFVEGGGVLVTLGSATALAAGAGLAPGVRAEPAAPPPDGEGAAGAGGIGSLAMPGADGAPAPPGTAGAAALPGSSAGSAPAPGAGGGGLLAGGVEAPSGGGGGADTANPGDASAGAAAVLSPPPGDANGSNALQGPAGGREAPGGPRGFASGGGLLPPAAELRVHVVNPLHPVVYGYPAVTQVLRRGGPRLALLPAARAKVVLAFGAGPGAAGPEGNGAAGGGAAAAAQSGADQGRRSGIEEEDIDAAKPASGSAAAAPPADVTASAPSPAAAAGPVAGPPLPAPLGPLDGRLLLAGSLTAGEAAGLDGRPAIVDVPLGRGHVVLFAFDPIDPTFGMADLRFVDNVLLNWHDLPR